MVNDRQNGGFKNDKNMDDMAKNGLPDVARTIDVDDMAKNG